MRALLACLLLSTSIAAQGGVAGSVVGGIPSQPPQPRDPRAAIVGGKGIIRGRVTAADTGAPMRRAMVTISGPGQRRTFTDTDGRYQFTGLPPARYRISASAGNHRPAYATLTFGAMGFNSPGKPVDLADGQVVENADIALPRGGVITGRVLDPFGEPAARVRVSPMIIRTGSREPTQAGPSWTTDDLGQFRLFGLAPGIYMVKADAQMSMFGGPADPEGEQVGFATTYAPGTPTRMDAMRVRVTAGGEVNVDLRLVETRVFTISGAVLTSAGEPSLRVAVSLVHAEPGAASAFGSSVGPNGTFTFRNVPPGSYEIVARVQSPRPEPPAQGPMRPPSILEMGVVRVDVGTTDLENVIVAMRPGETFTGEVVFDDGVPAGFRANISLQPTARRPLYSPPVVTVKGVTFTASSLFGEYVVRGSANAPGGPWFLKAVLLDGKDITDVPVALGSSHTGHVQVVFTARAATLEGTVLDGAGKPTREANILVFGVDEESWVQYSSRTRFGAFPRDNDNMTFTIRGLREGRYVAVAVPPGSMVMGPQSPDLALMEALKKLGTEVLLNPGESRSVELRLVTFDQQ